MAADPRRSDPDGLPDGFPASAVTPLWAHMTLRMADWAMYMSLRRADMAIRHFAPARVGQRLGLAARRVA